MIKKRGILLVGTLIVVAIFLTAVIRFSLTRREEKKEEQKKSLGERLAEADQGRKEEEQEAEEGVTILNWVFTGLKKNMSLEPYENALNAVLRKREFPWRVKFTAMEGVDTNGLADSLTQKNQLEKGEYDIVSCYDAGHFLLYGMLGREGLLEPLDSRLEEIEEGKRLKKAYPKNVWEAVQIEGKIYGVSTIPSMMNGTKYYLMVNEKMAEKYHVNLDDLTPEKLEGAFRTVAEGEWGEGNTDFRSGYFPEWMSGRQKTLLPFIQVSFPDGKPKLENVLEQEEYLERRKQELDLLCEGYLFRGEIWEESAIRKGNFFAIPSYGYSKEAAVNSFRCVYRLSDTVRLKAVEFPGQDPTFYGGGGKTGILTASKQKEEAFFLIAAIYSDPELSDALAYGQMGQDYVFEDGKVTREPGYLWEFYGGNSFLTLPGKGDSSEKRTEFFAAVESEKMEAVPRFDFDPKEVLEEWATLWQIYEEEWETLCHCQNNKEEKDKSGRPGTCDCNKDWEENLEKTRKAVKEAGIDEVMEYMEVLIREQEARRGQT